MRFRALIFVIYFELSNKIYSNFIWNMDEGESCIISHSEVFDLPIFSDHGEAAAAVADAIRRDKQVGEELQKAFGAFDDDDNDDDFEYNSYNDSFEEPMNNFHQNSKIHIEQSSTEASIECEEHTLLPDESNYSSSLSNYPTEYSQVNDSEVYHDSELSTLLLDEDVSNIYSNCRSTRDNLSLLHLSSSPYHSSLPGNYLVEHSEVNDSELYHLTDEDVSSIYNNHTPSRDKWKDENISQFHSSNDNNEQQLEYSDVASEDNAKCSINKRSYAIKSPLASYETKSALEKNKPDWIEYKKVQKLFEIHEEELNRVHNENIRLRDEIKSLKLTLSDIEGGKDRLFSLQESRKSILAENVETKSSGKPSVVLYWMWNCFAALLKTVTNLFMNLMIFAFFFAVVVAFVAASHHHHGGDAHGHYGPHGYEVTIHHHPHHHHGHHGGHGTSHRYFHIEGHHHHHHGHHGHHY